MKICKSLMMNRFFYNLLLFLILGETRPTEARCQVTVHSYYFIQVCAKEKDDSKQEAANHWLYRCIPRHRSQIKWYEFGSWMTWALLGNDDDGIFGEEPTAGNWTNRKIDGKRALAWGMRNPLHNFYFYVIGSADRINSEFVILKISEKEFEFLTYHSRAKTVFAGRSTSLFLGFHGWKPFCSLRVDYGRCLDMYIGWRERGNFGMKFVPAHKPEPKKVRDHTSCDCLQKKGGA